jgi:cleavage stimulation factor subunit 3
MADLFPEDPALKLFSHRYSTPNFDPTAIQLIISPSQSKPKVVHTSVENTSSIPNSPAPRYMEATNSPKRTFVPDEFEDDTLRPRKLVRGESPLKGAAGRRLDAARRLQQANGGTPGQGHVAPQSLIPPLPREVMMLLSVIPNAKYYNVERFNPEKMVELLRKTDIPVPGPRAPLPPNPIQGVSPVVPPTGQHAYPSQTSNPPMSLPPNPYPPGAYPPNFPQNAYGVTQPQPGGSNWNYR